MSEREASELQLTMVSIEADGCEQALVNAVGEHQFFVVKGATGSGKSWFVERLKSLLGNVVYVPQYPMFKPQLTVTSFLGMLPLDKGSRASVLDSLEKMNVPVGKRVGGKMMGMLDVPGLSGGQRKKLLLALVVQLAATRGAAAVVLDEPFAGIDAASMSSALDVLRRTPTKVFLVTHDHFELIETAFNHPPHLKIDSRRLSLVGEQGDVDTPSAAIAVAKAVGDGGAPAPPVVDWYIVRRHFVEGEHILPLFTVFVFGILSGVAAKNYNGNGEGVAPYSPVYAFLKCFMHEYIHFGMIVNYCFKRSQHKEDCDLLLTRKKDALLELLIIGVLQSAMTSFLLNGLLVSIAPRFWWINPHVFLVDFYYSALVGLAYTLLPVIQPNPLIVMGSIFPYVALWGFFNGILLPREFAATNSRWITYVSPVYQFSCATVKASNSDLDLPGSNCRAIQFHLALACPLLLFDIALLIFIYARNFFRLNTMTKTTTATSTRLGRFKLAPV